MRNCFETENNVAACNSSRSRSRNWNRNAVNTVIEWERKLHTHTCADQRRTDDRSAGNGFLYIRYNIFDLRHTVDERFANSVYSFSGMRARFSSVLCTIVQLNIGCVSNEFNDYVLQFSTKAKHRFYFVLLSLRFFMFSDVLYPLRFVAFDMHTFLPYDECIKNIKNGIDKHIWNGQKEEFFVIFFFFWYSLRQRKTIKWTHVYSIEHSKHSWNVNVRKKLKMHRTSSSTWFRSIIVIVRLNFYRRNRIKKKIEKWEIEFCRISVCAKADLWSLVFMLNDQLKDSITEHIQTLVQKIKERRWTVSKIFRMRWRRQPDEWRGRDIHSVSQYTCEIQDTWNAYVKKKIYDNIICVLYTCERVNDINIINSWNMCARASLLAIYPFHFSYFARPHYTHMHTYSTHLGSSSNRSI